MKFLHGMKVLTCIEMLAINLRCYSDNLAFFRAFTQYAKTIVAKYFKLRYDHCVPFPVQFSVGHSSVSFP
jgi:hypothetical protein